MNKMKFCVTKLKEKNNVYVILFHRTKLLWIYQVHLCN